MNRNAACAELGVYVLGGLDAAETDRFEEHLLTCDYCLGEADAFKKVRDLLLPLVGQPVEPGKDRDDASALPTASPAVPDDDLLTELLADLARERHRRAWRVAAVIAATAALVFALPVVVLRAGTGSVEALPATGSTPSPAVMLMTTGELHRAADPSTGVSGSVGLEDKAWGTHVALGLGGVGGPLTCSLVAVSKDGGRETVTSWSVPPSGYGVPGHPDTLVVHGGTSWSHGQLDHFEVRTANGRQLLSIPVR
ncbi:anti-sigma U factor RsuA [Kitasatospora paracochleata]|uniref:Anti-sigma factor RsiW n=1 Tax=Kitasatospora paracochleata TaxID=58354 RepID=A0ABT1J2D5_9ACTN|nr:zf-HC2 domain-containing protein [Kitasatospora paracochleata]MCP2311597.1 anti-sigma factor RsiW [Kitasatospora paracochleata]